MSENGERVFFYRFHPYARLCHQQSQEAAGGPARPLLMFRQSYLLLFVIVL
jgi:hypothetical protein